MNNKSNLGASQAPLPIDGSKQGKEKVTADTTQEPPQELRTSLNESDDLSIHSEDSFSELSESITDLVRHEVVAVIMSQGFQREVAKEILLMKEEETKPSDCEYVKVNELKDIVNKLISRKAIQSALDNNTIQFAETVQTFEKQLVKLDTMFEGLNSRMVMLEGMISSTEDSQPTKPSKSKSTDEKQSVPKKLRKKHNRKLTVKVSSIGRIKYPRMSKLDAQNLVAAPQKLSSVPQDESSRIACRSRIIEEIEQQTAEQRLFETNMLAYKKSPFTLHLNSHKTPFPSVRRSLNQTAPGKTHGSHWGPEHKVNHKVAIPVPFQSHEPPPTVWQYTDLQFD